MKPEDFIITRKRKKFKFAHFANMVNCYEAPEATADVLRAFTDEKPVVTEIGAGTGHFLLELARRHPEKRFVAIDVKADRLYAGARDAIKEGITNIIFIRSHVSQLETIIPNQSLNEVWVTFSDPYPKGRQAKHRLTHPHFLAIYQQLLVPEGLMHFKTDNLGLFHWSLEQFIAKQLQLSNLTFDLHQSNSPDEYKIMTTYERRFVAEGLPIYAVDVSFGSAES